MVSTNTASVEETSGKTGGSESLTLVVRSRDACVRRLVVTSSSDDGRGRLVVCARPLFLFRHPTLARCRILVTLGTPLARLIHRQSHCRQPRIPFVCSRTPFVMTSGAVDIPSRDGPKAVVAVSAASPKWQDTSAPLVSPRNRKFSVHEVATSPMAVNFHTWRVNALTTNAYRQAQFLEHAQKAFTGEACPPNFAQKSLKILKDLGLTGKGSKGVSGVTLATADGGASSTGYATLRTLLLAPTATLSDAEWLVAIKTFLAQFPELFDEFKEAFGVREDETPLADELPLQELETDKPFVRRSSSKVGGSRGLDV